MVGPQSTHPRGSIWTRAPLREDAELGPGTGATRRFRTACLVSATLILVAFMVLAVPPWAGRALANTNCPASTNGFGTQSIAGDCTIASNTVWGNGTLTIAGSVYVNGGVTLTLWSMTIKFSSTADNQHFLSVSGALHMEYGALESNDAYHWYLVSYGTVQIDQATIAQAGSGAQAGVDLGGPGGNRITHTYLTGTRVRLLSNHNDYFGYNNLSNYDDSVGNYHTLWIGANSTVEHNTFWDITEGSQSLILVYMVWGNVNIFANNFCVRANGNNAMVSEVINVQSAQRPVVPTGYTVRETWNNITWLSVGAGTISNGFDNEFSERVYIANNTMTVTPGQPGTVTECLEGGGMTNSVLENNTCRGAMTWGIYDYIYDNAGNVFQNNHFDGAQYGGIFQVGGNVVRNNVFTNLTGAGIWICPNTSCAGSSSNTTNNVWYGNTYTFASGAPAYLTRMDLSNALYNNFVGHGSSQWVDSGGVSHPVYGDWLFFANGPITHLGFADTASARTLTMTTGGQSYADREAVSGINDQASLAVDGAIDYRGSLNGGTVLRSLSPGGTTSATVTGTGTMTFTLSHYWPNTQYTISVDNLATGVVTSLTSLLDGTGLGQFTVPFGATPTQFTISFAPASGSPPPASTPPSVTTAAASSVGTSAATLNGNLGALGSATSVTVGFRYGTSSTLVGATNVTVGTETSASPFSDAVSGLSPGTTYYAAAWANGKGFASGGIVSFTTAATPPPTMAPAVSTGTASSVSSTGATLNGAVTSLGSASSVTVGFRYSTNAALSGASNVTVGTESSAMSFSDAVSGLAPSTTYYVSAWANGQGFTAGSVVSFVTLASSTPVPPTVATSAATSVSNSTATLNGNLGQLGTASSVTVGFRYGTSSSLAGAANATAAALSGAASFTLSASGWQPSTTYYFQAWASGKGFATGVILSVTTAAAALSPAPIAPTVTTTIPSKVAGTWATLIGKLGSMGSASSVVVGFAYSTSPWLAGAINITVGTPMAPGNFSVTVSGLTAKTTYYVYAWAKGQSFVRGNVLSFTTSASKRPGPAALMAAPRTGSAFTASLVGAVSLWWPGIIAFGMAGLLGGILLTPPKPRAPALVLAPHRGPLPSERPVLVRPSPRRKHGAP